MTTCDTCNDTHTMTLRGSLVPCTRCPTPCQECRINGRGAYCATTPCACACHSIVDRGVLTMRDPNRIDPILARLRAAWIARPDLRLGQLLVGSLPMQPIYGYPSDDAWMADRLRRLFAAECSEFGAANAPIVWPVVDRPAPTPTADPNERRYYEISGGGPSLTIVATSAADALRRAGEYWQRGAAHDDDVLEWAWFEIERIEHPDTVSIEGRRLTEYELGTVFSEEF